MTKKDAAKLLTLIKLAYPASYRDMDDEWKVATINMWAASFPDVPYGVMERGFDRYRMTHKFPPTVAEMVEQLRYIHYRALEMENIQRMLGSREGVEQCRALIDITKRFSNERDLDAISLQGWTGGALNAGTSGDRMDDKDGISFLDAGGEIP